MTVFIGLVLWLIAGCCAAVAMNDHHNYRTRDPWMMTAVVLFLIGLICI
jgi:hypothetical protein